MGEAAPDSKCLIEQLKLLVQNPDTLSHGDNESQHLEIQRLTRLAAVALETPPDHSHEYHS